jgi:pimeloyl-ACP methyl ester carboxylesterase
MIKNSKIYYKTAKIEGVKVFFREAGDRKNPTVLLLHGFPSSSHMFRGLIPRLAIDYHVIAPDYPGFGHSDMPPKNQFAYTFDHFANIIEKLLEHQKIKTFAMYIFDYGAPIGLRLFHKNPEKVSAIIAQNGNAYEEGLAGFWNPIKAYWKTHGDKEREALRSLTSINATKFQYEDGVPQDLLPTLSPDGWQYDQSLMDRPGNAEIQLDIFYDYRTNIPLYPKWQETFRKRKPPFLVTWGKNDQIFVAAGGEAYKRDLPHAEIHMLDTGHFALETHLEEIADLMKIFLKSQC